MKRKSKDWDHKGRSKKRDTDHKYDTVSLLTERLGEPDYNPPTPEESIILKERIIKGDQAARDEVYRRSLRRISEWAWYMASYNPVAYEDVFQQATIGASKALKKWDPVKGSFLPYAQKYMEGEIRSWLKKLNTEKKRQRERESAVSGLSSDTRAETTGNTIEKTELREHLERIISRADKIKNVWHRKFILKFIDKGIPSHILADSMHLRAPKEKYAKYHLDWYIPYLKEQYGEEEVKRWSMSKILRKLTNTHNYIFQRYFKDEESPKPRKNLRARPIFRFVGQYNASGVLNGVMHKSPDSKLEFLNIKTHELDKGETIRVVTSKSIPLDDMINKDSPSFRKIYHDMIEDIWSEFKDKEKNASHRNAQEPHPAQGQIVAYIGRENIFE